MWLRRRLDEKPTSERGVTTGECEIAAAVVGDSWRAIKIPGIIRTTVDGITALDKERQLSNVCLARDGCTCIAHTGYIRVILLGKYACSRLQAKGRRCVNQVQRFLDGNGYYESLLRR